MKYPISLYYMTTEVSHHYQHHYVMLFWRELNRWIAMEMDGYMDME